MKAILALPAALLCAAVQPVFAQISPREIEVASNYFTPSSLAIQSGGTVRWVARNSGHAVQADDGRFRLPATGTFDAGDSAELTFTTDDEWVRFHCAVHPEMRGAIKVGDPPLVVPDSPTEVRTVPSADYPRIADALRDIPAGTAIDLAPGVYETSIVLQTDGVRLRGTGAAPDDVVIEGHGVRGTGISGRASGLRVENLTLSGYTIAGVLMENADHFFVDRVNVTSALEGGGRGSYGIRVRASRHGRISAAAVSGSDSAAVQVDDCSPCDLIVESSVMRNGTIGLAARASSHLIVRTSRFEDNVTGLTLSAGGSEEVHGSIHVFGNTFRRNNAPFTRRASAPLDLAPGVAVWIDGVAHARVERNELEGHRYGIALTGLGGPSLASSIAGNRLAASTEADLAWDGVGLGVCFSGNAGSTAGAPSSEPPMIHALYPCGGPPTPGVPYPLVTAKVIGAAA